MLSLKQHTLPFDNSLYMSFCPFQSNRLQIVCQALAWVSPASAHTTTHLESYTSGLFLPTELLQASSDSPLQGEMEVPAKLPFSKRRLRPRIVISSVVPGNLQVHY